MNKAVHIDSHGITDTGKVRKVNEDQFLNATLNKSMLIERTSLSYDNQTRLNSQPQGRLFVVADGMGGHKGGQKASSIVVDTMMEYVLNLMPWFYRLDTEHQDNLIDELKSGLDRCISIISKETKKNPDYENMGTTLTLAYILWPRAYILHIGDSRFYLYRDKKLNQITKDDTVAQKLMEKGKISSEIVDQSIWSNILTDYVSAEENVKSNPKAYRVELKHGDKILLCTDGLTCHLSDQKIASFLGSSSDSKEICHQLITSTNAEGAADNTTVVVAQFNDPAHSRSAQHPIDKKERSHKKNIPTPPSSKQHKKNQKMAS